ncbi:hypothetical protein BP6252_10873 [Coleophoma cylindrospora]|uniref:Uncharacterized protein n=1 Tax=Coleophoma cylindrospora TaxID=1849047 RepID=A0A3D8QNS6_9HELO|nr:hypothetical protein BP6252_10873 [Coleophoma cylindrospora]
MHQLEELLMLRSLDFWQGEPNAPGCVWDPAMHGRSLDNAQPTIVLGVTSDKFRRNAKRIFTDHEFRLDPRGIAVEYYHKGLDFCSGSPEHGQASTAVPTVASLSSWNQGLPRINGASIRVGSVSCTLGGLIAVDGEIFGLTVAHAFERGDIDTRAVSQPVPRPTLSRPGSGQIGYLQQKRLIPTSPTLGSGDWDWALCSLENVSSYAPTPVPNDATLLPKKIVEEDPSNSPVLVYTGSAPVRGTILQDYSLAALPGSRIFQRMWVVVLERPVVPGDCGAWVVDAKEKDFYGHIIAGKPGTNTAYIALARDIFRDICNQVGAFQVTMPSLADLTDATPSAIQYGGSKNSKIEEVSTGIGGQVGTAGFIKPLQESATQGYQRKEITGPSERYGSSRMDSLDDQIPGWTAAPDIPDMEGNELIAASQDGDTKKVQQLLQGGTQQSVGAGLREAAKRGNLETVQAFLDAQVCGMVALEDALIDTAGTGHTEIVQLLLNDSNWDMEGLDHAIRQALAEATKWGETGVVTFLQEQLKSRQGSSSGQIN